MALSAEGDAPTCLTDLPLDVLLLIIPYLSVHDFLALSSTCHSLYDDVEFKYSPAYWSSLTRSTFRVPNQPVVQADGQRWMRLYRRMRTQSRVYGWGNNDGGCFGGTELFSGELHLGRGPGRRTIPQRRGHLPRFAIEFSAEPRPCPIGRVGVVSDLQCGGWMTVMLNSDGAVFVNGIISRLSGPYQSHTLGDPKPLTYPAGFVSPIERYDPSTAIRQVSAGRAHVLGLADSGRIWTWSDANLHALQIKLPTIDLQEHSDAGTNTNQGRVTRIVAGWSKSSAYVIGTGIVLWHVVENDGATRSAQHAQEGDTALVSESWTIPGTSYRRSGRNLGDDENTLAQNVGEVSNWIILDNFVVFVTDLGKVFASPIPADDQFTGSFRSYELSIGTNASETEAVDVQGSHASFAVLLRNGEVLTSSSEKLQQQWDSQDLQDFQDPDNIFFERIPCLQHTGVISLAFGDWHFHALHADGTITSHGKEPGLRGALGLGGLDTALLRGMTASSQGAFHPDGLLLRQCETTGRAICFEPEKRYWLQHLRKSRDDGNAERFQAVSDNIQTRAVMSEWVEAKLRSWDNDNAPPTRHADDEDELSPFFALSVAAAGHHSGAIVLVNEEAAKARKAQAQARYRSMEEAATAGRPIEPAAAAAEPSSLLGSLGSTLAGAGRSFLGIGSDGSSPAALRSIEPCSKCAATDDVCNRGRPCEHCRTSEQPNECVYPEPSDWWLDSLPRLRLPGGEVMPGNGPISDWVCPEWKTF